jgi:hypothetical protein
MISLLFAGGAGAGGWVYVTGISKKHGIHGLDKQMVHSKASKVYQISSRKVFYNLKSKE